MRGWNVAGRQRLERQFFRGLIMIASSRVSVYLQLGVRLVKIGLVRLGSCAPARIGTPTDAVGVSAMGFRYPNSAGASLQMTIAQLETQLYTVRWRDSSVCRSDI